MAEDIIAPSLTDSNFGAIKTDPLLPVNAASKSLEISQTLGIQVDPVSAFKPKNNMEVDIAPDATALRSVANESNETASLIKPDAKKLSTLEKYNENFQIEMKTKSLADENTKLLFKQIGLRNQGKELSEDELIELDARELEINDLEIQRDEFDLNMAEKALTGDLPSVFRDMGVAAKEHPVTTTLSFLGFLGGPLLGAATVGAATTAATGNYNYERTLTKTYRDLEQFKDAEGNALPHDLKMGIAQVSSGVQASLEMASDIVLKKVSTLWNGPKIAEKVAQKALNNPTFRNKLIDFAARSGTAAMAEGVTEVVQDIVGDYTEATGATWSKSTGINITEASNKFSTDLDIGKYGETFGRSFITGGASVGVQDAAGGVLRGSFAAGKKVYNSLTGQNIKLGPNDTVVDDVETPKVDTKKGPRFNLPATEEQLAEQAQTTLEAKGPYVMRDGIPVYLTPQEAILLGHIMPNIESIRNYNIGENQVATEILQQREAEKNGINQVFIDKEKLNEWADTSEKKQAVAKLFMGDKGVHLDAQKVPLTREEYYSLHGFGNTEFLTDNSAITSSGMTLGELKTLVASKKPKSIPKATDLPSSPEQNTAGEIDLSTDGVAPVDTSNLGAQSSDQEIIQTLNNKQQATAYVQRLVTEMDILAQDPNQIERANEVVQMIDRVQALQAGLPEFIPAPEVDPSIADFESFGDVTENVFSVMTPAEQAQYKDEITKAKTEMKQTFKEDVVTEYDQVASLTERELNHVSQDETINAIMSDDNIVIVETFLSDKSLRIDIETLSEDQKMRYTDAFLINDRKAFKKKGMHVEEVAAQMGITSDQLLEALDNSPTSKQAYDTRTKIEEARNKKLAADATEINKTAIDNTIDNQISLKKKMLTNILKADPRAGLRLLHSIFKAGSKTAIESVKINAQETTDNTRIGDLKPSSYLNASRRHMNRANTAMNKDLDLARGASNIEKSMVADELFKASTVTVRKVNKILDQLSALSRNGAMMDKLRSTGHYEAFQSLMAMLGQRKLTVKDVGAIKNLMISWTEKGLESDSNLPMSISQPIEKATDEGRAVDINDMSLSQVETVKAVIDQLLADSKNDIASRKQQQTLFEGDVAAVAANEVKDNLYFDGSRSKTYAKGGTGWLKNYLGKLSGLYNTLQSNDEMIEWYKLDSKGVIGTLWRQVKGLGTFDLGMGEKGKFELSNKVKDYLNTTIGKDNLKRLNSYAGQYVSVPEWKDSNGLLTNNGKIRKTDLIGMLLVYGQKDGRNRLSKYGIDVNGIPQIIYKYLHKDDIVIAKAVWGAHDFLKPGIEVVEKTLRGVNKVEFVDGESFQWGNETVQGGYIHFSYKAEQSVASQSKRDQQEIEKAIGEDKAFNDNDAARGFTKEGFKKAREKNVDAFINLDLNVMIDGSLGAIIANNTMLVPIYNTMRILNNPQVAEAYINVMGKEGYKIFKANVLMTGRNSNFDVHAAKSAFSGLARVIEAAGNNFMASKIIGSISSVFNQFLTFGLVTAKHIDSNPGVIFKSGLYMIKMIMNPKSVGTLIDQMSDHMPSIKTDKTSYQVDNVQSFKLFDKSESSFGPKRAIVNGSDVLTELWLSKIMGGLDTFNKTAYALAMMDTTLKGKAKGGPTKAQIAKMSEEELLRAVYAHVDESIGKMFPDRRLSSASYVQTHPVARAMVPFFNDARRAMNSFFFPRMRDGMEAVTKFTKSAAKNGVASALAKSSKDIVFNAILIHVYASVIDASLRSLRGEDDEGEKDGSKNVFERWFKIFKKDFIDPWTAVRGVADVIPVVSGVKFLIESDGRGGGITTPTFAYLDSFAKTLKNFYDVKFNDDDWNEAKSRDLVNAISGFTPFPASPINNYIFGESTAFQTGLKGVVGLGGLVMQSVPDRFKDVADKLEDNLNSKAEASVSPTVNEFNQSEVQQMYATLLEDPTGRATLASYIEQNRIPFVSQDDVYTMIFTESNGNPDIRNGLSGATGIGQFVNRTWNDLKDKYPYELRDIDPAYRYEVDIPDGSLDGRTDPTQSMVMLERLHKDIAITLIKAGIEPTQSTVYIGHHFGASSAVRLINANDTTKAKTAYGNSDYWEKIQDQNPWIKDDMTIGEFKDHIEYLLTAGAAKQKDWEEENGPFDPFNMGAIQ